MLIRCTYTFSVLLLFLAPVSAQLLYPGNSLALRAVIRDQFGEVMDSPPPVSWEGQGGSFSQQQGEQTQFTAGTLLQDSEVKARTASGLEASLPVQIRSQPAIHDSYSRWKTSVFASHPSGNSGAHTEAAYIPHANGLSNFEYYAFGLDPTDATVQRPMWMSLIRDGGLRMQVQFLRPSALKDARYELIQTEQLSDSWALLARGEQGDLIRPVEAMPDMRLQEKETAAGVEVTIEVPVESTQLFLGLRIVQDPAGQN